MSFILEALKKSEEERRQGAGPDLNALHALAANGKPGRRIWLVLFFPALLINALFLLWWLHSGPSATEYPTTMDKSIAGQSPTPVAPPVGTVAQDRLPVSPAGKTARPSLQAPPGWNDLPMPKKTSRSLPEVRAEDPAHIPFLHELPAEVRRQIPELAVTLHYYTADPTARLARVNGTILREGHSVTNRLLLERITDEAIVFRFGEERFRLGEF